MNRAFYDRLVEWETKGIKEPMMVIGPRQVGKTWLINQFCRDTYADYMYINFESNPEYVTVFDGSLAPDTILHNLSILSGRHLTSDTAIFFDEIQICERAITALKYLCESEDNYRILCAGSLLGVKLNRFSTSFPVGKVRILNMHPMTFDEFLLACGEDLLIDAIASAARTMTALPAAIHDKALRYYYDYLWIGGMPRNVTDYIEQNKAVTGVDRTLMDNLSLAYKADMTKYTLSAAEGVKISSVYDSVPRHLAKSNPKFKYKEVRSNANKRDFQSSIDWLITAGLVLPVYNIAAPRPPLNLVKDDRDFKLYLSDTGMLSNMCQISYKALLPDSDNVYKGMITENYVVQEFAAHDLPAFFFKKNDSLEVDLLIEDKGDIIPIEIKSGRHKRSTSLNNYMKAYAPPYAIRISARNFGEAGGIKQIPLYAAFCIAGMKDR